MAMEERCLQSPSFQSNSGGDASAAVWCSEWRWHVPPRSSRVRLPKSTRLKKIFRSALKRARCKRNGGIRRA